MVLIEMENTLKSIGLNGHNCFERIQSIQLTLEALTWLSE